LKAKPSQNVAGINSLSKAKTLGREISYLVVADRFGAGSNRSISIFELYEAQAAGSKRWLGFSYGT